MDMKVLTLMRDRGKDSGDYSLLAKAAYHLRTFTCLLLTNYCTVCSLLICAHSETHSEAHSAAPSRYRFQPASTRAGDDTHRWTQQGGRAYHGCQNSSCLNM